MTGGLFAAADGYDDNPIAPVKDKPTPDDIVAALTPDERVRRVQYLTARARAKDYPKAMASIPKSKTIAAVCVLLSGGQDSTTVAHMFRRAASHIVHVNTGIGIPQTTQFVRDLCVDWGLPLVEVTPDDTYADLILGKVKTKGTGEPIWPGGFPGPGSHGTVMYPRLKERALDKARHQLGIANSRTHQAIWVAGRRRAESARRVDIPSLETDGSVVWFSPVANWTKLDLATYRQLHDVPVNPVTEHLHMSGECLCGAFATPGELDELRFWYPEVAAHIEDLQRQVVAAGYPEPFCQWGHGQGGAKPKVTGRLCSTCDALFDGDAA